MAERQPIATAPKDGSEVTIYWTDADGVMNESIGRWQDGGWWVYVDSDTKKRVQPSSWRPQGADET